MTAASASAERERGSVALRYVDIVLVALAVPVLLAAGAPATGLIVGAAAWIVLRIAQVVGDKRLVDVHDLRRRLGLGVALAMLRVWLLATAIIVVGLTVSRADALTCALLIFGAFSVNFARNAVAHVSQKSATG